MNGMPPVTECQVDSCFYNREKQCHAPAINVGSDHPECDTFIPKGEHISRQGNGMVGACHVAQCRHNNDLTCQASGITVAYHESHADCGTFDPRG
ncbi:MAG: DUF1540 domain-containing protein [Armatimonadota bacterium]